MPTKSLCLLPASAAWLAFTAQPLSAAEAARLESRDGRWVVTAPLPTGARAWFANVRSGPLTASSDFCEITP